MSFLFWHRITGFFSGKSDSRAGSAEDRQPTLAEIQISLTEEFRVLRKTLRKQTLLLEETRSKLPEPVPTASRESAGAGLMRLASTFFHLEQSLLVQTIDSAPRRQAVALFWLQIEQLLDTEDICIIRELEVDFDPRLHRAVLVRDPDAPNSVVVEVLEPGFIEHGQVRTPAKVILGKKEDQFKNSTAERAPVANHKNCCARVVDRVPVL
ncbi:nucleotide exchange factor GrpE [Desulfobulbus alkaliphilus]|uniref:nucleotide exchange factor GrpE n=1 Tax=Desulfobulbus alkaliphilus TaxID=869814 RepID=UPI001965E98D|nr:nucleotide exchange factor GrpE [Desulfobulbus alkaliphilus]MBM9536005.1 nucleotide exchange factor GrpE [Desulfobulbus alkaliphilus]